ncbi:MAG: PAS domain S-box protein [Actinomycetota bacterium]
MQHGYCLTVDGKIVQVNDERCRITGFAREELVGTTRPYPFWDPARYGEYFAAKAGHRRWAHRAAEPVWLRHVHVLD